LKRKKRGENKMILFVASNPSKLNTDPTIAMVGSKSEKTFNSWAEYLSNHTRDFVVINASNKVLKDGEVLKVEDIDFEKLIRWTHDKYITKIVALGNVASKALSYVGAEHYKLPHPSPRNRFLNNTEQVEAVLENCKQWLET
jgi:hypothetical protein